MNEKVKVIKVELKQEYGEEKLKTYYPEDVELDDIIMSVYSLLNFTSIMFEYSSYQFDLDMSQIKTCLYESKENIENMLQKSVIKRYDFLVRKPYLYLFIGMSLSI